MRTYLGFRVNRHFRITIPVNVGSSRALTISPRAAAWIVVAVVLLYWLSR